MTLPIDLVLLRHGESEGNVATRLSRKGDNRYFTDEFRARHESGLRLSPLGRKQALKASMWIQKHFPCEATRKCFDRHITSEYVRAMETAGLLCLPNADWYTNFYLRERCWGDMNFLPDNERRGKFSKALHVKEVEPFYWKPPNGESIADLCLRVDRVLHTLHRECSDKRVIIVCHGEVMWAFRVRLERLSQKRYKELDLSKNPHDHIHNCHILHYTRRDRGSGEPVRYANWMRSVCPWDTSLSTNEWREIKREQYTNNDLLALVNETTSMIE